MPTQLFVPKFRIEETLSEIRQCLEMGWTGLGFKTLEIEREWSSYSGFENCHFLASNTVGLHLAVEILKRNFGWEQDDEIISTPLTFVSTNHAILYSGLTPVFADVDKNLCMDAASAEALITDRTRAIMYVGIGGNPGQYEQIADLCRRRNLKLILDAAHMAGTRVHGQHVGLDADVTVFSFQAVKNLPTADSGMICFKDKNLDESARKLSWLGINKDTFSRSNSQGAYKWLYDVEDLGYKYHGNSIMAAMALVSLKYLDQDNAYRRQLATWYESELRSVPGIEIINHNEDCESSRHLFQIAVKNRDKVMMALNEHEVYPGVHYRDNSNYSLYEKVRGNAEFSKLISEKIISLPMHLGVTHADVLEICELLNKYAN